MKILLILCAFLMSSVVQARTLQTLTLNDGNTEILKHCDMKKIYLIDARGSMLSESDLSYNGSKECTEVSVIDPTIHSINSELEKTPFKADITYQGINSGNINIVVRSRVTNEKIDEITNSQSFLTQLLMPVDISQFFKIEQYLAIVQGSSVMFLNTQTGQFCNKKIIVYRNHRTIFVKYHNDYYWVDSHGLSFSDNDVEKNMRNMESYLPFYQLKKISLSGLAQSSQKRE